MVWDVTQAIVVLRSIQVFGADLAFPLLGSPRPIVLQALFLAREVCWLGVGL